MGDSALPTLGWGSVAMSLASLGVVCVLAYLALRWLAGRGVGRAMGAVKILARCPLEPRRSVYLIETAGRCFLVGVGDGPMSLLAEVDGQSRRRRRGPRPRKFAECWRGSRAEPGRRERRRSADVAARASSSRRARRGRKADEPPAAAGLLFAMGALSLVPFALLMTTCFVRVAVVLSILRSAIGTPQVPPTQVLTGLALILTLFVMAPTGERMYHAVEPVLALGAGSELLSGASVDALGVGRRPREGAAARVPAQARRRARPRALHGLALRAAHAGGAGRHHRSRSS